MLQLLVPRRMMLEDCLIFEDLLISAIEINLPGSQLFCLLGILFILTNGRNGLEFNVGDLFFLSA